ncbi:MAG: hypothetical protein VX874_21905 [Pseudomonadota bacterium]|nr:hypothetical protein [Pseudomonadota bacterium]
MFENWEFLISEMIVLLVLAALLGVIVGWIIWGRRKAPVAATGEVEVLRAELATCREAGADQAAEIARLQDKVAVMDRDEAATTGPTVVPTSEPAQPLTSVVAVKPETLDAPRAGAADDLKQIKGVGPKLEALVNKLGFYHFDQIAAWTPAEVSWVDDNLEGFKGRVTRDGWVEQARVLADGGSTAFSKKVKDGDVY